MSKHRSFRMGIASFILVGLGNVAVGAGDVPPPAAAAPNLPMPRPAEGSEEFPLPPSILPPGANDIDLGTALRLAGVENPEILLARQQVVLAVAERQLAAAKFLPNLNYGTSIDLHQGTLQQSNGNILKINRGSMYMGLGAYAVAAGSVNIPGIQWWGAPSDTIFNLLIQRQMVRMAEADSIAMRNDILLRVADGYMNLLRAECRLVVGLKNRKETAEIARITANYARTGQGRKADANRAASELSKRDQDLVSAQGDVLTASAALARLLNLDPSVRLHALDGWVVPAPMVPDPIPMPELIAIALTQRPELEARRAAIRGAFLAMQQAKVLPFSPNLLLGYSAGGYGGGSNLVAQPGGYLGFQGSRFGSFASRQDADAIFFWTIQNMGLGNVAMVRAARSRLRQSDFQELIVLDMVRNQVAAAYARTHARFAQIGTGEEAVSRGTNAFHEDLTRILGAQGLPIEVLDSLRLLVDARFEYLDAIINYNRAQFQLYVALGQPPAKFLARPIPPDLVAPAQPAIPPDGCPAPAPTVAKQG